MNNKNHTQRLPSAPKSSAPGISREKCDGNISNPTGKEQDINFIDVQSGVPRRGSAHYIRQSARSRCNSGKQRKGPVKVQLEEQEIDPNLETISAAEVLAKSQEREVEKVYEVCLHGGHIGKISNLDEFIKIRVLDLSCNSIKEIENLDKNTDLRELKLYDNKIQVIDHLQKLKELCHLQLQHNKIGCLGNGLNGLKKLQILRLDSNSISRIDSRQLASVSQLKILDISNNNLDTVAAVSCLPNLEELYATNNRLTSVADLSRCKKLQEVDFSFNRIADISGLKGLSYLKIVHCDHNILQRLNTMGKIKGLQELYVSHNRLREVRALSQFYPNLQILDVAENSISSWNDICSLKCLSELVELFVSGNTFSREEGEKPNYFTELQKIISSLEVLDGAHVKKVSLNRGATPIMRPMTAAKVVSSRQVENQLKSIEDGIANFESSFANRFDSLKSSMQELPVESVMFPLTPSDRIPDSSRPSSRSGKRSRIRDALSYAAANCNEDIDTCGQEREKIS